MVVFAVTDMEADVGESDTSLSESDPSHKSGRWHTFSVDARCKRRL